MDKVIKIKFDESSGLFVQHRPDIIEYFLKHVRRKFTDIRKAVGYVYLNDIYEHLGIKWNPDNENLCFKNRESDRWPKYWNIRKCKDGSWNITIHYKPE